ncbi:MAG TPA: hypothetical protein VK590_11590 [Saprospiraceae bacterium]|nr:hypothetical protein [Saprospiraceae bacterium]
MTTFAYTRDIPNPPNNPSSDVPNMKINTNSISDLINVDHISFGVANGGYHKVVHLSPQTTPGTIVGIGQLYSKTISGDQQLFYKPGSGNEYQLTRTISASFARFGVNIAYGTPPALFTQIGGWTFLPGGLLMQYGFYGRTGATGSSGNIQFPVTWRTGAYSISLSLYRNSGNQSLAIDSGSPPSTTQFSFLSSASGSDGIYWSAIGK